MVHCVAFGCNQKNDDGKKGFFLFPKDPAIKKKWIEAVGSCREMGGKRVPWVPSKTSRLCKRHFIDSDFVHSPAVMESVGIKLKLELKKTAVPTVFPETDEYKENRKPLQPSALGPAKRKRDSYGAFEKRNRKQYDTYSNSIFQLVSEILQVEVEVPCDDTNVCTVEDISETVYHQKQSHLVSRAAQTNTIVMEHKSFQIHPKTRDMCVMYQPSVSDCASGPEHVEVPAPIDKNFQFPESIETDCWDSDMSDYEDNEGEDPDWRPDDWDVDISSDEEIEEDWQECSNIDETGDQHWIVSEAAIMQLLLVCQICGLLTKVVKKQLKGALVLVTTQCACGAVRTWESMKSIRGTPAVNLLGSGALTFCGASITKVLNFFKFLKVPFVSYRTFNRIQRAFILPVIDIVWKKKTTFHSGRMQRTQCEGWW